MIVVGLCLAALAISLTGWYALRTNGAKPPERESNLVGLAESLAVSKLSEQEIRVKIVRRRTSAAPPGIVMTATRVTDQDGLPLVILVVALK